MLSRLLLFGRAWLCLLALWTATAHAHIKIYDKLREPIHA